MFAIDNKFSKIWSLNLFYYEKDSFKIFILYDSFKLIQKFKRDTKYCN